MSRLTVKGLRAIVTAEGVSPSGRPFTVSTEAVRHGEAYVERLSLGAEAPGGSNASRDSVRSEADRTRRAYVGAVCAALLSEGVAVPGKALAERREALSALSAPSVLIPGSMFPGDGKNETARVTMAVYRDGEAVWAYVLHDDPETAGDSPGYVRAIRDRSSGLWRAFLSAT